jgi:hypothetical protein
VSETPKFPWDMSSSERLAYKLIAGKAPEDRTPIEASLKRYIDMLLEAQELENALVLAEHKIDQYLQGQYPGGNSLGNILKVIRTALAGTKDSHDID